MKHLLAIGACAGLLVLYSIGAWGFGYRNAGETGAVPLLLLLAAEFWVWRQITGRGKS